MRANVRSCTECLAACSHGSHSAPEHGLPVIPYEQGDLWCAASWLENDIKRKTTLFGIGWESAQEGFPVSPMVDCCCEQHVHDVSRPQLLLNCYKCYFQFYLCMLRYKACT